MTKALKLQSKNYHRAEARVRKERITRYNRTELRWFTANRKWYRPNGNTRGNMTHRAKLLTW